MLKEMGLVKFNINAFQIKYWIFITQADKEAEASEKPDDGKAAEAKEEDKEAEKKPKPQKKSKISVDIGVELEVNDVLNPSPEEIDVSKKK